MQLKFAFKVNVTNFIFYSSLWWSQVVILLYAKHLIIRYLTFFLVFLSYVPNIHHFANFQTFWNQKWIYLLLIMFTEFTLLNRKCLIAFIIEIDRRGKNCNWLHWHRYQEFAITLCSLLFNLYCYKRQRREYAGNLVFEEFWCCVDTLTLAHCRKALSSGREFTSYPHDRETV